MTTEVAEVALLAPIDVLADPAGKHDPVDAGKALGRIGEIELAHLGRRIGAERCDEQVGHPLGHLGEVALTDLGAKRPAEARARGVVRTGRVEARDAAAAQPRSAARRYGSPRSS